MGGHGWGVSRANETARNLFTPPGNQQARRTEQCTKQDEKGRGGRNVCFLGSWPVEEQAQRDQDGPDGLDDLPAKGHASFRLAGRWIRCGLVHERASNRSV